MPAITYGKNEMLAGAMVLTAMVLIVVLVLWITQFRLDETHAVYLRVDSADGAAPGTPVILAGAKAGHVDRFRMFVDEETGKTMVELGMQVYETVFSSGYVHHDATATVSTDIFGKTRVVLSPGSPRTPLLEPGDRLTPSEVGSITLLLCDAQRLAAKVSRAVDQVQGILDNFRQIVGDAENQDNIRGTLAEARLLLSDDLRPLVTKLDSLVERGQAKALAALDKYDQLGTNLVETSERLDQVVANLDGKLDRIDAEAQSLLRGLNGVVEENRDGIRQSVLNVEKASGDLRREVADMLAELRSSAESIRRMTAENEERINAILADLEKTSGHAEVFTRTIADQPWRILWKTDGRRPLPEENPLWKSQPAGHVGSASL